MDKVGFPCYCPFIGVKFAQLMVTDVNGYYSPMRLLLLTI